MTEIEKRTTECIDINKIEQKPEWSFTGVWIPKEIWLNDNLLPLEKMLFSAIKALDKENGCFASNAYLAKFFSVTERHISGMIGKLIKLGLVSIKRFDGRKRYLTARVEPQFDLDWNCSSMQDSTTVLPYNKDYNKDNNNNVFKETTEKILKKIQNKRKCKPLKVTEGRIKIVKNRMKDGAVLDDFIKIISAKWEDKFFRDNPARYFTIETLFRKSNFWKYREEYKGKGGIEPEKYKKCPKCGADLVAKNCTCGWFTNE